MIQIIGVGLLCSVILGFVVQRGRFCLSDGFKKMYITQDNRIFHALLVVITIQAIAVHSLREFGILQFNVGSYSWVAVVIGSFVFGIGLILAGGCIMGTCYRAAEGRMGSWIALSFYLVTCAVMRTDLLSPLNKKIQGIQVKDNSIANTFDLNVWFLITLLLVITTLSIYQQGKKPKVAIPVIKQQRTALAYHLFEKRWQPFFTAILLGGILIITWLVSGESGYLARLGTPLLATNSTLYLVNEMNVNWEGLLVLSFVVGSFIAAKVSGEFRLRIPSKNVILSCLCGGILMGVGASLAGGSSIGNGLIQTALFTWQGWISLLFMILGAWTATYIVYIRPSLKKQLAAIQIN